VGPTHLVKILLKKKQVKTVFTFISTGLILHPVPVYNLFALGLNIFTRRQSLFNMDEIKVEK
jgi:hypothetical protein